MCITFETLSGWLDNARMRIQDLFEDLEAQFDAEFSQTQKGTDELNARAIEIKTKYLIPQQLIAPIFGVDFLAGLDPVTPIWHIFPLRAIKNMRVIQDQSGDLPNARSFNCDSLKFLNSVPHPCAIRWRSEGSDEYLRAGVLGSISHGMLVITDQSGRELFVPMASLQQLSIEAVDNFGGNF